MRIVSFIILFSTVLVSCGTSKNSVKEEVKTISKADYPYIEQFHKAVRLKTRGDVDGAITAFNQCLLLKQDDDAVYYALSQLELAKGNFERSAEMITEAQRISPENIWYTQEMAYMYYENSMFEKAAAEFKKLVEYEEKNLDWLYGYADCLIRLNKTEEAITNLKKAEDVIGVNPGLSAEIYRLYMTINKEQEALNTINAARKVFPNDPQLIATLVDHYFKKGEPVKAVSLLEELVEADPGNGRAKLALGDVYRQQNKKAESYKMFKEAMKAEDLDIDTKMQVLISIQQTSYKIEPEALELAEIFVLQYPNEAKSHSIHGDYLLSMERDDEALTAYKEALKYDKDQFPIWNQVIFMEYQKQQFDSLYYDSKECLSYFTTMPTVYLLNAVAAVQLKKYDEAIQSLEIGKELVIDDRLTQAEFYGQLGESYFGKKDYKKGQEFYDKAVTLDPGSNLIKNNYAYRLGMAKVNLEKALELISKADENSPNQPHYIDTKGWVLFQMGKYTEALEAFTRAVELSPNQEDLIEHLGDALFKTGKVNEALTQWQLAKEKGAKNKSLDSKIANKTYYDPEY